MVQRGGVGEGGLVLQLVHLCNSLPQLHWEHLVAGFAHGAEVEFVEFRSANGNNTESVIIIQLI